MTRFPRQSGVLLHPTSLPGRHGIGDLGQAARQWIDFLRQAGQQLWQVLPLGPTGFGDSPYQCFSAWAGNPYLVSPDDLAAEGLLAGSDLEPPAGPSGDRVDYGWVATRKRALVERAYARFRGGAAPHLRAELEAFRDAERSWLDDCALFLALKSAHHGAAWHEWELDLRLRRPPALAAARARLADEVAAQEFGQFLFFRQWGALRTRARAAGVRLIGDVPMFVAYDSADVWQHRELFALDPAGRPLERAGVPPDYFAVDGQLWGNPLYDWDRLAADGYRWWIDRLRHLLRLVDIARLDHFRGLAAYWAVPGDSPTARTGTWRPGPGAAFLDALRGALGGLPFIAEDLGLITDDVLALRDRFGLPGMRVLQFAFGGDPDSPFLPHNYPPHTVVYTGTHDNDTTRGWYQHGATANERAFFRRYTGRRRDPDGAAVAWDFVRLAWASVADLALAPMQDLLGLSSEARMNHPGRAAGNWTWRLTPAALSDELGTRLGELTALYSRALRPGPGDAGGTA
jgi:4-alpha-glucanotransferase